MSQFFLDSVYLIALEFEHDQHHQLAAGHWASIAQQNHAITTTSFVLDEVVTHLNSRGRHARAVRAGEQLQSFKSGFVQIDQSLFDAGWAYFKCHCDKRYSLTDYISFVVMQQRGIRQALTFDQHFTQAGFECAPGR